VTRVPAVRLLLLLLPLAAGCGSDGTGPTGPILDCSQVDPTQLTPGEFTVMDASEVACVRVPAAGAAGAEYLYLAISAAGTESSAGTSTAYRLVGAPDGGLTAAAAARTRPRVQAAVAPTPPQRFHQQLRRMERTLARQRPPRRSAPRWRRLPWATSAPSACSSRPP
jgi:hypothetical protein